MRRLVVAGAVVLAVAGCSSSPAELERAKDAEFVETVQDGSVVVATWPPAESIDWARKHCRYMAEGIPRYAAQISAVGGRGWSEQDAELMMATAEQVYCPELAPPQ